MYHFARVLCFVAVLFSPVTYAVSVVASIPPLAMVADALLMGMNRSVVLVDGHQSEHSMSLSVNHRQALATADLVLWISPEFESWLVKPLNQVHKPSLAMRDIPDIQLLSTTFAQQHDDHATSTFDLHLWLDPSVMQRYVVALRDSLVMIDPVHAVQYNDNAAHLLDELQRSIDAAHAVLAPVHAMPLLVMHDAWRYYFRYFKLTQGAQVQVTPEQSLGAASMSQLEKQLQSGRLGCLLREPQFEPKRMRWLKDNAPHLKVALTDPLGYVDYVGGYPAWLLDQAKAIASCVPSR